MRSEQRSFAYAGATDAVIGSAAGSGPGAGGLHLLGVDGAPSEGSRFVPGAPVGHLAAGSVSALAGVGGAAPVLYVSSRVTSANGDGDRLAAWAVDGADGSLRLLGEMDAAVGGAAHLIVMPSGRFVVTANYGQGSVGAHRIGSDGSLGAPSSEVFHAGHGLVPGRQEGPHPHMVGIDVETNLIHVPDLGADRLFAHELDEATGTLTARQDQTVELPAGSGPRHVAFLSGRGLAVLVNELSGTVALLGRRDGRYRIIEVLPASGRTGVANAPSGVRTSLGGELVYVANRGPNTVAAYVVAESGLRRVAEVGCGGDWPRDLVLDEAHSWLYVANHRSHEVSVLAVSDAGVPGEAVGNWPIACPNALALVQVGARRADVR